MATTGHESEAVNVQGLKAAFQKFKTDKMGSAAAKNVPSTGDASSSQVVLGNDSRLTNARAANGGNADTIDSYHISVVSSMPASPSADTIYIVK